MLFGAGLNVGEVYLPSNISQASTIAYLNCLLACCIGYNFVNGYALGMFCMGVSGLNFQTYWITRMKITSAHALSLIPWTGKRVQWSLL